jgi:phosphinothricin acetyltransferase
VAGYAYASSHRTREAYRWSIETSVYVDAEYHRQGIARGLYESLLAVCRLQGFRNAYAGTTPPNPASVSLHESMGFESIGVFENVGHKNGEWHDMQWWARPLGAHPSDLASPLSIAGARSHERWDDALRTGESTIRL